MPSVAVDYQLLNTNIDTIPLAGVDAAGDMVALPAGVVPTLVNALPASLNAVIGVAADGVTPALVLNSLVIANPGISVEIDDGSLSPFMLNVIITDSLAPTSVGMNLGAVTHATQARPTRCGWTGPRPRDRRRFGCSSTARRRRPRR